MKPLEFGNITGIYVETSEIDYIARRLMPERLASYNVVMHALHIMPETVDLEQGTGRTDCRYRCAKKSEDVYGERTQYEAGIVKLYRANPRVLRLYPES